MLVLGRVAKATVEAAKKVKLNSTQLKQALSLTSAELFDHVYSDRYRDVGKAFGLEAAADKSHSGRDWQQPLKEFVGDSPLAKLVLTFCAHNFGEHAGSDIYALAKLLKVDVAAITKDADKELATRTREELARARRTTDRVKNKSTKRAAQ